MAAAYELMEGFHQSGAISRQELDHFDRVCLVPAASLSSEEIRSIRERENVSQPVFAQYLNVSKGMVSAWERGVKSPSGPAVRLLKIVQRKGLRAIL